MEIKVLAGRGMSIREMVRQLNCSRNTVRWYLREEEAAHDGPRAPRPTKLDAYKDYLLGHIEVARPHWITAGIVAGIRGVQMVPGELCSSQSMKRATGWHRIGMSLREPH
ncbi:hypothetical protein [Caldimonas brevitalea]|uniref:hypothetical protein n=1 Tax=Caldimonas brevitalea TaxID=413882 RepID=UPI0012FC4945|nr:hypothetical protein [Caldimonas brevitalea]